MALSTAAASPSKSRSCCSLGIRPGELHHRRRAPRRWRRHGRPAVAANLSRITHPQRHGAAGVINAPAARGSNRSATYGFFGEAFVRPCQFLMRSPIVLAHGCFFLCRTHECRKHWTARETKLNDVRYRGDR